MDPTAAQEACFELGIKFGSLYHQFAGTPVSPETIDDLATAMESAIENQPYCRDVTVEPQVAVLDAAIDPTVGYTEFTGEFAEVEIVVEYDGHDVTGRMVMEDDYPRMELVDIEPADSA